MKIRRNAKGKITISDMSPGDVRYLAMAVDALRIHHFVVASDAPDGSSQEKIEQERALAAERLRNVLLNIAKVSPTEITLTSGADPAELWQPVIRTW